MQAVRPCDAWVYLTTVEQFQQALQSPDIDDPASAPHAHCLTLHASNIPAYIAKVRFQGMSQGPGQDEHDGVGRCCLQAITTARWRCSATAGC